MLVAMPASCLFERLIRLCLCVVLLSSVLCSAQSPAAAPVLKIDGLGKGAAPLNGPWQFHLGDDLSWAQPAIDDATGRNGWEQLTADQPWGAQGHANYTGFAWYRKHVSLSLAPGAPDDVALLIPIIDDAYELYWNGVRVGSLGSMPPRLDVKIFQPQQTYGLGPIRSGVLAVRVFKTPLSSVDDGTAGGFEAPPVIGAPRVIGLLKTADDYRWMQRRQASFGLTTLYALASLLSFFAWLRDRRQKLIFWAAAFTFIPILELVFNGMRIEISGLWDTFFVQAAIQLREICQWFLLAYLLQLEGSPRLMRNVRILAWTAFFAGALDGALSFCFGFLSVAQFTWIDAALTGIILLVEPVPLVLVLLAIFRRQRLDHARWLVAFFAFAGGTWYTVSNIALQGIRYTHWTLPAKMSGVSFTLFGSAFPMIAVIRLLLFLSILYAVLRYAVEHRHRQTAIEQELQAARELQQVLVPETLPEIPGYKLTSAYKPAQEVGGDFFQIIPLESGQAGGELAGSTLIVLGDVSGKGLKAAMIVSLIVGAIRTIAETTAA
ncbi:MAG TPA: SpoIIE family protein phosphatase, partial [Acidobacteriaceae bacterium]